MEAFLLGRNPACPDPHEDSGQQEVKSNDYQSRGLGNATAIGEALV
ncbi:MAG: hypothetical protein U1D30_14900 [Planctomycetota bacterium]